MIHDSLRASSRWIAAHWSRDVAVRPGRQNSLSSSMTGSLVISPRQMGRVDLPSGPGPFTHLISVYGAISVRSLGTGQSPGAADGLDSSDRDYVIRLGEGSAHPYVILLGGELERVSGASRLGSVVCRAARIWPSPS